MRVIDAVPECDCLHKAFLVEDGGKFSILHQANGRLPTEGACECGMSNDLAFSEWGKLVHQMFFRVTRNHCDSEVMTNRRLATLH